MQNGSLLYNAKKGAIFVVSLVLNRMAANVWFRNKSQLLWFSADGIVKFLHYLVDGLKWMNFQYFLLRWASVKSTQRSWVTLMCLVLYDSSNPPLPRRAPLIYKSWDSWNLRSLAMRSGILDTFQSPNILILWFIDSQLLFFQFGGIILFSWLGRKKNLLM